LHLHTPDVHFGRENHLLLFLGRNGRESWDCHCAGAVSWSYGTMIPAHPEWA